MLVLDATMQDVPVASRALAMYLPKHGWRMLESLNKGHVVWQGTGYSALDECQASIQ